MIKEVISSKDLQTAINGLSQVINNYCKHEGGGIVFICIMKGGFMFFSDLLKSINLPSTVSFVKMASYEGTNSTGTINELIGLNEDLSGKDIIVVEDIVDTGNTLEKLYQILADKNAKSIKIATLLYKPEAYKKSHPIDYVGLEIPNAFVLGYGLDYDGLGRNLSSIFVLKE